MERVKAKGRVSPAGQRPPGGKTAIGVKEIGSEARALQRKIVLIAPVTAVPQAALLALAAIAPAHDEELDLFLLVHAVLFTPEPALKTAKPPVVERQRRLPRKLELAGHVAALRPVRPRADDQQLRRLLGPGERLPVEHILPAPGIVPARDMVDRH